MHLNFRQGLISFQQAGSLSQYLTASNVAGYIDLNVSPTPLIATIAHGSSDYLLKFDVSMPAIWGPLVPGVDNYLYIELDLITGELAYRITTIEPIVSLIAPVSPTPSQMWFDLNAGDTVFKVRNNDNTKWITSPRLVIGKAISGNVNQLLMYAVGTTANLTVPGRPGYLMLDSQLRPLRTSTGELLTQDTGIRVKTTVGTSGVLSVPVNSFVPVRANEAIPAMSLVYLSGIDSVSLASSNPALTAPKTPIGIVETALAQNETGVITQVGEIVYDQWNWTNDIGKPLYCGFSGELTTTRPASVQAFRVGYVKGPKTVLFYIDSETTLQVLSVSGSIISGTPPLATLTEVNGLGEIVTTVSIRAADNINSGYMSSAQATLLNTFGSRLDTSEASIVTLQGTKSNVGHLHAITDVIGLQNELTNLSSSIVGKANKIVPAANGNFAALNATGDLVDSLYKPSSFAVTSHVHLISEVTGLQTILNLKTDVGHVHTINDVTNLQSSLDNKAFVNHTHSITNVSGLQIALDGKAAAVHTHIISDVTNLQTTLNGKASSVHVHVIDDVSGLTSALSLKSDVGHLHNIADVINLQSSLNGKADTVHTHVSSDITNFSEAVDDRVAALLVAGTNIALLYNDASNTFTISNTATAQYLNLSGFILSGLQTTNWGTNSLAFSSDFVTTFAGTGSQVSPGSASVSLKKLNFFEGATLRSSYPNAALSAATNIVFGSGLAATVSGASGEILTVTAPSVRTLDGLDDVAITSVQTGQTLMYNGTDWVNGTVPKPPPLTVVTTTSTAFDIGDAADHNVLYRCNSATAVTLTVQPDSFWPSTDTYLGPQAATSPMPTGGTVLVGKRGIGNVVIVAGAGVTINTPDSLTISKQHGKITLIRVGPNEWDIEGNLAAA